MKTVLIAPNEELLHSCLFYVKSTLGYTVHSYYVCQTTDELKELIKTFSNTRVYLTQSHLLPWNPNNLNFIIQLFKEYRVSIFLLDIRMELTADIYGKPAADILLLP